MDDPDAPLIRSWLHARPATTRAVYAAAIAALRVDLKVNLAAATLDQLQAHADSLAHLAPRTQGKRLAAIRSFYAWHVRTGTLERNPAAALRLPKIPTDLAERILTEAQVGDLLAKAASQRDYIAIRLLYMAGLRASELVGLRWRNVVARGEGGQLTVHGKGGKTRHVAIDGAMFSELASLRGERKAGDPVFGFSVRTLQNIVARAGRAAGFDPVPSCHWLRHCTASHLIAKGVPISDVQTLLGHSSIAVTGRYLHSRPSFCAGDYLAQNSDRSAA